MLIFLLPLLIMGNMASPGDTDGWPRSASAMVSKDIDIIHEDLFITLNEDFTSARFNIKYYIKASNSGIQVPLIFYASEYRDDFVVQLDGKPVALHSLPEKLSNHIKFKNFYSTEFENNTEEEFDRISPRQSTHSKLKYFELDISAGSHIVSVIYNADITAYERGTVKTYGVSYDLWPAKNWKSFGNLVVNIDNKSGHNIKTNLGNPGVGRLNHKTSWKFNEIPNDTLEIIYEPELTYFARIVIILSPVFSVLLVFGLIYFHIKSIKWYRKNKPYDAISWTMLTGAIFIPLVCIIGLGAIGYLENLAIGEHAGRSSGSVFGFIFIYPLIHLFYIIAIWIYDYKLAKSIRKSMQ